MADQGNLTANPAVKIVAGGEIDANDYLSYTVDRDMFQPDMAAMVVSNQGDKYSDLDIGAAVTITVGQGTVVFQGEIVALEPTYKGGEKTRLLIRAMNKLHRLLRKRKSLTFTNKTDQAILSQVVGDAGLSLDWQHDKTITYKHVYQHNQTDLEFLRTRAARMGCHVWCVDTTVHCKQPKWEDLGIELKVDQSDPTHPLRTFSPRKSSAAILKKCTVKGWNPETKELITGEANIEGPLGSEDASAASKDLGKEETFTVDHPIWSKEEADALAKARLQDLALSFITGEAETSGDPTYELGKCIKITANANKSSDPFNGKYYIMGVTHRHIMDKTKQGGFMSILRVARNAQRP